MCRSQEHLCYVPLLGDQVPSDSIQTNLCMFFKVLRPLFGTFTALTVHGGSASPVVFSLGNVRLWEITAPSPVLLLPLWASSAGLKRVSPKHMFALGLRT